MSEVRYYKNGRSFWKFESGRQPQIRCADSEVWRNSLFPNLNQFLSEPEGIQEAAPEEAEPPTRTYQEYHEHVR